MEKTALEKINRFTRRELAENEVYTFSVVLCDNEIDRDLERFSDSSLETLRDMFIGKTGIFDHDPSTANQTARIYDTEIVTDESRLTKNGEPYRCLKGYAYTLRTDENKTFIAEIDGGIKKEVSISCAASRKICSICGADRSGGGCSHVKGRRYNGKICHNILDGITDAYEWSFVAVPAQVNAGVTKKFSEEGTEKSADIAADEISRDILRGAFISGGVEGVKRARERLAGRSAAETAGMRKMYQRLNNRSGVMLQLEPQTETEANSAYKI